MSLDFPASPTEGQTYAAEGAMYRFESGRWVILSQNEALTAIFGGDVAAGWSVFGDTLIQWGTITTNASGEASVVFSRSFAGLVSVTAVPRFSGPSSHSNSVVLTGKSSTGFSAQTSRISDGGAVLFVTMSVDWIAIGEALDADKTPKVIAGVDAASFLVPRSEWDIFKSAYEDTVRVLEVEEFADTNTYNTANTTTYGASGPAAGHTPLHPDSLLKVECAFKIQVVVTGGTVDDAGYRARLMRYDGASYVPPSAFHNGAFSEARYNNVDTSGTQSPNWSGFMTMTLGANERRSDTGNWTARVYYNTVYAGEATITADTMFRFTEYLPPGVT